MSGLQRRRVRSSMVIHLLHCCPRRALSARDRSGRCRHATFISLTSCDVVVLSDFLISTACELSRLSCCSLSSRATMLKVAQTVARSLLSTDCRCRGSKLTTDRTNCVGVTLASICRTSVRAHPFIAFSTHFMNIFIHQITGSKQ